MVHACHGEEDAEEQLSVHDPLRGMGTTELMMLRGSDTGPLCAAVKTVLPSSRAAEPTLTLTFIPQRWASSIETGMNGRSLLRIIPAATLQQPLIPSRYIGSSEYSCMLCWKASRVSSMTSAHRSWRSCSACGEARGL